jgi:hypothetical protein
MTRSKAISETLLPVQTKNKRTNQEPLIPAYVPSSKGGRRRSVDDRAALYGTWNRCRQCGRGDAHAGDGKALNHMILPGQRGLNSQGRPLGIRLVFASRATRLLTDEIGSRCAPLRNPFSAEQRSP